MGHNLHFERTNCSYIIFIYNWTTVVTGLFPMQRNTVVRQPCDPTTFVTGSPTHLRRRGAVGGDGNTVQNNFSSEGI